MLTAVYCCYRSTVEHLSDDMILLFTESQYIANIIFVPLYSQTKHMNGNRVCRKLHMYFHDREYVPLYAAKIEPTAFTKILYGGTFQTTKWSICFVL